MARKPQVRYWQRKGGGYFCTLDGVQHELALGPDDGPTGPTFALAVKKFAALMALGANVGTERHTVGAVCNKYRLHLDKNTDKRRLQNFNSYVRSFAELHGGLAVAELAPRHVTEWLDRQTQWKDGSKATAALLLLAALNWAAKEGHIPSNPLKGRVTLPEPSARGEEYRMPPELRKLLIRCAPDEDTRLILRTLDATGARPIELFQARGRNLKAGKIVLPWQAPAGHYRHKNAKKVKRDRIILLPNDIAAELKVFDRDKDEYLFQYTAKGKPVRWNDVTWQKRFNKVREHPDVVKWLAENKRNAATVIPYGFRHSFLSEWVERGGNVYIAAQLTGTSVSMIEKTYGHPDAERMAEFYHDFLSKRSPQD